MEGLVPGLPGHDGPLVLVPGAARQAALVQRHHLRHNNHHILTNNKLAVQAIHCQLGFTPNPN